jgi:quercetin 2,3-dioxygenase
MIKIRKANQRGQTRTSWLDSYHSFSFNQYFDPENMGFSDLRVINEDFVDKGAGFPPHSHRDMEILTYVLSGELMHRDSTGGEGVIHAGEIQRMTAGTGVTHSEFNHSQTEPVHLLQIWILPDRQGLKPGYEQKAYSPDETTGRFRVVASKEGTDGSVKINQDASLNIARIPSGQEVSYEFKPGRKGWLQVSIGTVRFADNQLEAGDGAAISGEERISVSSDNEAEVLLFDLP